jgi:hypothetical protein
VEEDRRRRSRLKHGEALHCAQQATSQRRATVEAAGCDPACASSLSDVPLEVMRLCARGLELAATVAAHSARPASADVQLGVTLLQAGFDGHDPWSAAPWTDGRRTDLEPRPKDKGQCKRSRGRGQLRDGIGACG